MKNSSYFIKIFKESVHFNAAHFTIFSPLQRERLHGHDYYLKAYLECDTALEQGLIFNYQPVKDLLLSLTRQLDEYYLLPEVSNLLSIKRQANNIEFYFGEDFFSLPKQDVKLLPLENISNELLLTWFYQELLLIWNPIPKSIIALELELENGRGQSISRVWRFK